MAIQDRFSYMSVKGPIYYTILFILNDLIRTIIPLIVISKEVTVTVTKKQQYPPHPPHSHLYSHGGYKKEFDSITSSKTQNSVDIENSSPGVSDGLNWARYMSIRNRKN